MGLHLQGKVSLDGSGFEQGLQKVEHAAGHAVTELKNIALAAFGIYGVEAAIHGTIEAAEKLIDTSRRIGVGIEALQEFGFAARENGADIEELTKFIEKLNTARIDPKKWGSFGKLGISESDIHTLGADALIMKLHENVRDRSSQEIIGPLRDIGGKSAGVMIPMLKDDMEELRHEAHALGQIMKTEDAVMLKFLADEMKVLSQVITVSLAPAIAFVMDTIMYWVNKVKSISTFAGSFIGNGGGEALGDAVHDLVIVPNLENFKKSWGDLMRAFEAGGIEALYSDQGGRDEWEKRKAALIEKQKEIEKINAIPDFSEVIGEPKEKKLHDEKVKDVSDSLTRAGNFLGGSRDLLAGLAERQVNLLQEIANNTAPKQSGSSGQLSYPNS